VSDLGLFATVKQVIDTSHYAVIMRGVVVEALYYRSETLAAGDRVFIEKLGPGAVWVIASSAGN